MGEDGMSRGGGQKVDEATIPKLLPLFHFLQKEKTD